MSKRRIRILSLILLFVFSFTLLTSSLFIIFHTEHNCSGEDCSVCLELNQCYKMIQTLGTAVSGAFHFGVMLYCISVLRKIIIKTRSAHITLISLKVELLN